MPIPLDITFKGLHTNPDLAERIRAWTDHLERIHERILGCEVTIDAPHRHHRQGRHFHVKVRLRLPGEDLVVSRDAGLDGAHEDAFVAAHDAFRAVRRQLEDRVGIAQDARG